MAFASVDEALVFLRANRDTHTRWAKYFEQNPAVEAEYVATGVWEGAKDQRRLEQKYNSAISMFEDLVTECQSLSNSIKVLEVKAVSYDHAHEDAAAMGYPSLTEALEHLEDLRAKEHN